MILSGIVYRWFTHTDELQLTPYWIPTGMLVGLLLAGYLTFLLATYFRDFRYRRLLDFAMQFQRRPHQSLRLMTERGIWFQIVGDLAFFIPFYASTGKVESDFFLFFFLPILVGAQFRQLRNNVILGVSTILSLTVVCLTIHWRLVSIDLSAYPTLWRLRSTMPVLFIITNVISPRAFAIGLTTFAATMTVHDVRRRMRSEELYRSLVTYLPEEIGIFRKDLSGRFLFVNLGVAKLLGERNPDSVIGKDDSHYFSTEFVMQFRKGDQAAIADGIYRDPNERLLTHDQRLLYIDVIKTPIIDATGRATGVQGIFLDITQRRKLEEDLRSEISRALTSRRTQLESAARIQALAMMASSIAHEIRCLTSAADKAFTYVADNWRDEQKAQAVTEYVDETHERIHALFRVVDEFLSMTPTRRLNVKVVRIDKVLDRLLEFMNPDFLKAKVTCERHYDLGLPEVTVDQAKIWSALASCFVNALEAMSDGGVFQVRTFQRKEDGNVIVLIELRDSGPGFPADVLNHPFEPFLTTKPNGSGLGLIAARMNVEQLHRGTIHIGNAVPPEKGAIVTIALRQNIK